LELGRNLEGDHIREGIDVYFDCHVVARPNAVRLVWRHQVSLYKQLFIVIAIPHRIGHQQFCHVFITSYFRSAQTKFCQ
jgi:hypothetical protein